MTKKLGILFPRKGLAEEDFKLFPEGCDDKAKIEWFVSSQKVCAVTLLVHVDDTQSVTWKQTNQMINFLDK